MEAETLESTAFQPADCRCRLKSRPPPASLAMSSLRCYLWLLGVLRCLNRANFACLGVRKSKPSCLSCTSCSSCPDSPRWFTALTSLRSGGSGSGAAGIAALILLRWLRPDDPDSSDDSDYCVSIWYLGRNIVETSKRGFAPPGTSASPAPPPGTLPAPSEDALHPPDTIGRISQYNHIRKCLL